jgi:hypothetical protein
MRIELRRAPNVERSDAARCEHLQDQRRDFRAHHLLRQARVDVV